jgi:hypothetical protein
MKPIIYVLELCDTSGPHRPIAVMRSSSPFPPASIGDRFDDEGWRGNDPSDSPGAREDPRRYIVHSIKHVVVEEKDHILARYCINLTPHIGPRSPIWGHSNPVAG